MGSGSNSILIVSTLCNTGDTISTVTWNGTNMTLATKIATRGALESYIYYAYSPTTGTHNIVSNSNGTSCGEIDIGAASYFGVAQSGFPDSVFSDTTTNGTSNTFNLTTVANNAWAFGGYTPNDQVVSAGTNSTLLRNNIPTGDLAIFDNSGHGAITPAGSFSMTMNASLATQSRGLGVSFAPYVAPVATPFATLFSLFGDW